MSWFTLRFRCFRPMNPGGLNPLLASIPMLKPGFSRCIEPSTTFSSLFFSRDLRPAKMPSFAARTLLTLIVLSSLAASVGQAQLSVEQRASRFLHQATFGPTQAEITSLATSIQNNITAGQSTEVAVKNACSSWIDTQQALGTSVTRTLVNNIQNYHGLPLGTANSHNITTLGTFDRALMQRMVLSQDQLRHRVAVALSEIFVISVQGGGQISTGPIAVADYYDTLLFGANGSFNSLLANVSLHPLMGVYLSHLGNTKKDFPTAGTFPDENYAREVMQLFSCGLYHLNDSGQNLDATGAVTTNVANFAPTYTNAEITEMARVFTGLVVDPAVTYSDTRTDTVDSQIRSRLQYASPMVGSSAGTFVSHDQGQKTLLKLTPTGPAVVTPPWTSFTQADPVAQEVRWVCANVLAAHASTPPFIVRQLIKKLVTSNPSPAYVNRVVQVWKDSDPGTPVVRGNMKAVVKAILTDVEALTVPAATATSVGKLREPCLVATNIQRAFGAAAQSTFSVTISGTPTTVTAFPGVNRWTPLDGNPSEAYTLVEEFFNSPSVFNFFSPGFSPTGPLRNNNLSGPEFQILSESSCLANLNHYYRRAGRFPLMATARTKFTLRYNPSDPANPIVSDGATPPADYANGNPGRNSVTLNFTPEDAFAGSDGVFTATEADALLSSLNTKLCYGTLSSTNRNTIRDTALMSARTYTAYPLANRVRDAIFLVMATPNYLIQK